MNRRTVLTAIAFGALAGLGRPTSARANRGTSRPLGRVPAPVGVLSRLPGDGNQVALTIDDGASVSVVAAIVQFCRDTGTRLTFFVNGANDSWTVNAPVLRPLVDSGQIQLGNHTWSHPYLNRIPLPAVEDQIRRNADFLTNTYGTDGRPYFRPPFGVHTADTDRVAADLGYPTIAMWSSTIGDSRPENEASLIANANAALQPQQIVLAHANLPTITDCFNQLSGIIASRNLQTVTLNDVFA
ncbi:putative xylanase/chitin deacetylase (plasmid) [Mycobacterium sp. JS623]|uniref:polysaccharide deacetylase family protein n=1 Tax=Mycobacterium sp. JS623 TaxID=212767 RepID=UPI0002A5843B|nr:polysaccharide deacetylase family protein [Mycobacterium sp. JS623]AGB26796.1 putative xylanase/chitin deacetylase [Mycobacterium sp. JS623]